MADETNPGAPRRLAIADVALGEYHRLVQSVDVSKWETLLNSYYGLPYEVTIEEAERCLLSKNVARANHGMLRAELDKKKAGLLDMVYERPTAARITYTANDLAAKMRPAKRSQKPVSAHQISETLSEGFQRYVIRPWRSYSRQKELLALDMLLFGKGISLFDQDDVYPRYVPTEKVWPNRGASFDTCEWEYCFVVDTFPASKLWRMASADARWDKKGVTALLRRQKEFQNIARRVPASTPWSKLDLDGEWQSQLETVSVELLALYVTEWDGSLTKRYLDIDASSKRQWIWEAENYAPNMENVIICHTDDLGHGKYYSAPSYAEKVYLACKEYDYMINAAVNGAWINSMLILESRGGSRPAKVLRDHMLVEPNTVPVQHRFQVPISEMVEMADKILGDLRSSIGSYTPQERGDQTAYEKRADLYAQERINGVTEKRWNECQGFELREMYRRLIDVAKDDGKRDGDKARKQFVKFCKDRGLDESHWKPENVAVDSVIQIASGEPSLRLDRAVRTLDILRIKPNSPGESAAQRDAIAALNGMSNVDDYVPPPRLFPDDVNRIIGFENESLKDANAKGANVPVLPGDPHLLHLTGNTQEGGSTIGHVQEMAEEVKLGLQMLEMAKQTSPDSLPLLADKIASQITYVNNLLEHSMLHMGLLAGDQTIAAPYREIAVVIAQIVRQRDELVANFGRFQEARQKMAQQQQGGDGEAAKSAIKLQEARQLADIKVASAVELAQAKIDIARAKGEQEAGTIRDKAAADLAGKLTKHASDLETQADDTGTAEEG